MVKKKSCYVVKAKVEGLRKLQGFPNAPCFRKRETAKRFIESNIKQRDRIADKYPKKIKRFRITKYKIIKD